MWNFLHIYALTSVSNYPLKLYKSKKHLFNISYINSTGRKTKHYITVHSKLLNSLTQTRSICTFV